jgi:hypothetical protein
MWKQAEGRRKPEPNSLVEFDLLQLYTSGETQDTAKLLIEHLIRKAPIADLSGSHEQMGYRLKVWLMSELKQFLPNNEQRSEDADGFQESDVADEGQRERAVRKRRTASP